jgi:hypothetical protein
MLFFRWCHHTMTCNIRCCFLTICIENSYQHFSWNSEVLAFDLNATISQYFQEKCSGGRKFLFERLGVATSLHLWVGDKPYCCTQILPAWWNATPNATVHLSTLSSPTGHLCNCSKAPAIAFVSNCSRSCSPNSLPDKPDIMTWILNQTALKPLLGTKHAELHFKNSMYRKLKSSPLKKSIILNRCN